jgi:predicted phage terminase large subunit-like protein
MTNNKNNEIREVLKQIKNSRQFRKELANKNIFWFFSIYFHDYIKYESADFQKEIFSLISDEENKIVAVTAFRNSAKSTICSLVLPIWSVLGKWKKKYVLLVLQNQNLAKGALINIRKELEGMNILVKDYLPKNGKKGKWTEEAIVLPKYGAKIAAVSIRESIRGTRYLQHRPGLVVADDLEDVNSCRSSENRRKVKRFVNSELIPIGDRDTKFVFIGNKVHRNSLMMNLKQAIKTGVMNGVYREYPLVDDEGKIAWPGKYPDMESVKALKKNYSSEIDFKREQMLKIISDDEAIIKHDDIKYYEELPEKYVESHIISIDPAVSEKDTACNTGIVNLLTYRKNEMLKIFVAPLVINEKLSSEKIVEKVSACTNLYRSRTNKRVFVESVGSQSVFVDLIKVFKLPAEEVKIGGQDKRTRLNTSSVWIKNARVLFPKKGAEELIDQLCYFGTEKYDDLVDALTLAINKLIKEENERKPCSCRMIKVKGGFYPKIR